MRIYVNGVLKNLAGPYTGTIDTGIADRVIGKLVGSSYNFSGLIDDVRIYNYARTQAQILQDYNSGFSTYLK